MAEAIKYDKIDQLKMQLREIPNCRILGLRRGSGYITPCIFEPHIFPRGFGGIASVYLSALVASGSFGKKFLKNCYPT